MCAPAPKRRLPKLPPRLVAVLAWALALGLLSTLPRWVIAPGVVVALIGFGGFVLWSLRRNGPGRVAHVAQVGPRHRAGSELQVVEAWASDLPRDPEVLPEIEAEEVAEIEAESEYPPLDRPVLLAIDGGLAADVPSPARRATRRHS